MIATFTKCNLFQAQDFLKFAQTQSRYYQTNNIIITMGDDFNYQDALSYFSNLDRLIKYVSIYC